MSACKSGCGALLTWATSPAGTAIPLVRITRDRWQALPRREALYVLVANQGSILRANAILIAEPEHAAPDVPLYLNHFVDCPNRDQFKKPTPARGAP